MLKPIGKSPLIRPLISPVIRPLISPVIGPLISPVIFPSIPPVIYSPKFGCQNRNSPRNFLRSFLLFLRRKMAKT